MAGHPISPARTTGHGYCLRLSAAALLLAVVVPLGALAQGTRPVIERIVWEGLRRIPRDTMNARIISKPGDPYNPTILKRDFHAVWNTGYFENVTLQVSDGDTGKIITFIVEERPLVRRIEYDGVKSVQQSEILEAFRKARVGLTVEMQYDPTRVRQAEVVLKQLLSERGRHFAQVGHEVNKIPPNAVILVFVVDEGPKVKVGKIRFDGNRYFSDGRLVRAMKGSRPMGIPPFLYFINKTFNERKMQEDLERVREVYQQHGFFRVVVHPPDMRYSDTEPILPLKLFPFWFKPGKAVNMRIAVEEGARYRMGKLEVTSATGKDDDLFFKKAYLRAVFPLREGDIFDVKAIRDSLENYRKLYGEVGYINMTTIPETKIDDNTRTIDITLEIEPNKQFYVHRIEFQGNTTTRDKVIRRELLLDEGSLFNSRLWELSVLRLNQLGYFEELKPEDGEVEQNAEEGTVDLTLKVKEKGKNSIGLTGGSSGVLGSFLGLSYSTNNFLGLGETLNLNAQYGDRTQSIVFGFTEPYLFDRPLQTGFTIFRSRFKYDQARETGIITGQVINVPAALQQSLLNYTQNTTGFTTFASYPLKRHRFTRVGMTYSYSTSDITCITTGCSSLFETLAFRSISGPNALEGISSSRVTPTFLYNSTNHPFDPNRGTSIFVGFSFEGGPLGGTQKSIEPTFEIKHYKAVNHGRNVLAIRVLGAFLTGYGGQVASPSSRFYIGGEDNLRGFDIRAVTPLAFIPSRSRLPVIYLDPTQLTSSGEPTPRIANIEVLTQQISIPGGDTQLVSNFEYRIPIAGPVQIAPFLDAGVNTVLRPSQLRLTPENIETLRTDFPTASVPDNLQLVPGTNGQIRASSGLEMVVNIPILNAPFRIYWAYNFMRLKQDITFPGATARVPEGVTLPPGVLESQIVPNLNTFLGDRTIRYAEPLRAFRFTISRTF